MQRSWTLGEARTQKAKKRCVLAPEKLPQFSHQVPKERVRSAATETSDGEAGLEENRQCLIGCERQNAWLATHLQPKVLWCPLDFFTRMGR
jgi:hypothetical protein